MFLLVFFRERDRYRMTAGGHRAIRGGRSFASFAAAAVAAFFSAALLADTCSQLTHDGEIQKWKSKDKFVRLGQFTQRRAIGCAA